MKNKTFTQQKRVKKLTNIAKITEYLRGKTIRILNTAGSHNYGGVGTILKLDNSVMYITSTSLSGGIHGGNTLTFDQFTVLDNVTKEDILKNIEGIQEQIIELENEIISEELKITFLKETRSKTYNENEFKAFKTLSLMEDDSLSKIQKAQLIAKLID